MILGMTTFTFVHVVLSLIGILSGFVVVFGLLAGKRLDGWTALFLVTTVLTSVTGFLFPFHKFLPSHGIGIVSLVVLAIAIFAVPELKAMAPTGSEPPFLVAQLVCMAIFVVLGIGAAMKFRSEAVRTA